jgi:hypothetical protein
MNNATNIKQSVNNMNISHSRHLWCTYAWTTRNYVVSSLGNLPDAVIGRGWVIHSIHAIAEPAKQHFGSSASLKIIQLLYSMFNLLVDKVSDIKNGQEIIDLQVVDIATLASLAELMHNLNPSWGYEKWLSTFEIIFNLMVNHIAARAAEEWVLDMQYQEAILEQFEIVADNFMVTTGVKSHKHCHNGVE